MTLYYHCEREGCDTHQRVNSDLLNRFLTVSDGGGSDNHLCSMDCLTHWAAAISEPTVSYDL